MNRETPTEFTVQNPDTEPPDPGLAAGIACPNCGGALRRTAHRLGGGWIDRLACVECKESLPALRQRKKAAPPILSLPAGELSARSGNLDEATAQLADDLDTLVERAIVIQRELLEGTWGPRAMPPARRLAIRGVTTAALANLSEENIAVVAARVVGEDTPAELARPAPWVGWTRRGRGDRWRAVVHGQTEAETLDKLLNHTCASDKLVLESPRDPNKERRPR